MERNDGTDRRDTAGRAFAGGVCLSLPRHGKTARFVGTEWEGYVVVMMIGFLGIGVVLVFHSATALLKAA